MVESREVVIVSPYQRVTEDLRRIIVSCEPTTAVGIISELNGLITVEPNGVGWGKDYPSLRAIDFAGRNWNYNKEPNFGEYVERQLRDVSDALVREMMEGHHPSLVIDLEQLIGNWGDVIGVYNIAGFGGWCSQNRVPRLTLPAEMKATLRSRLQGDGFQGAHTETPYFDENEKRNAEKDLRSVLAGNPKGLSLFQYQA